MMGKRGPCRNGAELDAVTGWRRVLAWNHVRRSYWKRTLRRRERQMRKREDRLVVKSGQDDRIF
jgi:hypothetical protein